MSHAVSHGGYPPSLIFYTGEIMYYADAPLVRPHCARLFSELSISSVLCISGHITDLGCYESKPRGGAVQLSSSSID